MAICYGKKMDKFGIKKSFKHLKDDLQITFKIF